jgi:hypothetical protein
VNLRKSVFICVKKYFASAVPALERGSHNGKREPPAERRVVARQLGKIQRQIVQCPAEPRCSMPIGGEQRRDPSPTRPVGELAESGESGAATIGHDPGVYALSRRIGKRRLMHLGVPGYGRYRNISSNPEILHLSPPRRRIADKQTGEVPWQTTI